LIAAAIIGLFVLVAMGLGYFEYRAACREAEKREQENGGWR